MNTLQLKLMVLDGLSRVTYETHSQRMEALEEVFEWLMAEAVEDKDSSPIQLELFENKDYDA